MASVAEVPILPEPEDPLQALLPPNQRTTGRRFAAWVSSCISRAATSAYTPAVLPGCFEAPLEAAASAAAAAPQARLLVLGDSVNRYMVEHGCTALNGTLTTWCSDVRYMYGNATLACTTSAGVAAFMHIYGSPPTAPYWNHPEHAGGDPWVDTVARVPHAIQVFTEKYGAPTAIVFRSDLWDLGKATSDYNTAALEEDVIAKVMDVFLQNNRAVFEAIAREAPQALLGVHTIPNITWWPPLFSAFQESIRELAQERDLFLFDFGELTQAFPLTEVLMDTHHPKPEYCAAFQCILFNSLRHLVAGSVGSE
jgi:hypothetical protein